MAPKRARNAATTSAQPTPVPERAANEDEVITNTHTVRWSSYFMVYFQVKPF